MLTRVERWAEHHQDDPRLFFAVAWLFAPSGVTPRIVLGDIADIDKALAGESVYTVNHVSMALVLHQLRVNAAAASITLPQRLTIDERDKPAYENWRRDIDAYREAADARTSGRPGGKSHRGMAGVSANLSPPSR